MEVFGAEAVAGIAAAVGRRGLGRSEARTHPQPAALVLGIPIVVRLP